MKCTSYYIFISEAWEGSFRTLSAWTFSYFQGTQLHFIGSELLRKDRWFQQGVGEYYAHFSCLYVGKLLSTQTKGQNIDLLLLGFIPRVKVSWRILTKGLRSKSYVIQTIFNKLLNKLCLSVLYWCCTKSKLCLVKENPLGRGMSLIYFCLL